MFSKNNLGFYIILEGDDTHNRTERLHRTAIEQEKL